MLKQEGYDLIGAAFEVYNTLGYGMAEEIYQQSLEIELGMRNIAYQSKSEIEVDLQGSKALDGLPSGHCCFRRNSCRAKSSKSTRPRTRRTAIQLTANQQEESRLPHQLWRFQRTRMETVRSVKISAVENLATLR